MLALLCAPSLAAPAYVRAPDLHGDTVVFAAIGDLWLADVATGHARQLTTHPGDESAPSFSPDGKTVAFNGMYDGNADVYVIPATGGEPRRLTWHPWRDEVTGWTPDGKVLFRTGAEQPHGTNELFAVDPAGGDPAKLPLGFAARLAVDPSTGRYAFDRIGYERRTWKRYRGGMAGDIWVGDPKKQDFAAVTSTESGEGFPMWHGGRVWFLSDRGGTADLWSMNADGTDAKRHTNGGEWDARTPAMGNDGRIVFARAGDLWLFDPATGAERKVELSVEAERSPTRRRWPWAMSGVSWFALSPDADRVLLVTRGEVFAVPVEDGPTLPVTLGSGARESWASWSPDGKRVIYVTDRDREEAIVTADAWGRGDEKIVKPAGASGWHHPPLISPDGARVAWSDGTQRLYVAPVGGGTPKEIDRSEQAEIVQYVWSPDGRYLAYVKLDRRDWRRIHVWDSQDGSVHAIGTGTTDDHSPAWDPEGRWLWFASERGTNPLLGWRDFQVVEVRTTRLAMALLRPDVENPFADRGGLPGEDAPVAEEKKKRKKKRQKEEGEEPEGPKPVRIDWEGLDGRIHVLDAVGRGNFGGLLATADALYYLSWPTVGMAEEWPTPELRAYSVEDDAVTPVLPRVQAYDLSAKANKLLVQLEDGFYVVDAGAGPPDLTDARLDTAGVVVEVEPREEWKQIYFEAWRHMRDFYWDEGMGGLDWVKLRDQYATLLPRISSRAELSDLLGELIGELATSHTYVWGGDNPLKVDWVATGLLGGEFRKVGDAYEVVRVFRGDPADEAPSPLQRPGNEVREGEFLVAINHRPFRADRPLLAELEGKAGVPVLLTVAKNAAGKDARTVVVTPIPDEGRLRYVDWVRRNREYVAEKSGGRFGYVHVPDMATEGLVAFETWFYPQLDKEGLVVDVRWNGGGFVSQLLVERLGRELLSFDRARGGGVFTYPYRVLNGPFVVVTNEFAGSDGDIFPKAVQLAELAPVIGMRSWGGVVGISPRRPLVDGGVLTQPEYASWYPDGGWIVENHGVDPDIVVQNLPQELARGVDAQLDRALQELGRLHAEHPPLEPDFGPAPPKGRTAFGAELEKK